MAFCSHLFVGLLIHTDEVGHQVAHQSVDFKQEPHALHVGHGELLGLDHLPHLAFHEACSSNGVVDTSKVNLGDISQTMEHLGHTPLILLRLHAFKASLCLKALHHLVDEGREHTQHEAVHLRMVNDVRLGTHIAEGIALKENRDAERGPSPYGYSPKSCAYTFSTTSTWEISSTAKWP